MQTQKWVNLGLLVATGIVFYFLTQVTGFVWDLAGAPRFEEWPVSADILTAFVLAVVIGLAVRSWEQANRFFNEVFVELSKVSWPLRKETIASSGVVVVLVAIAAALLALMDLIWGTVARGFFAL